MVGVGGMSQLRDSCTITTPRTATISQDDSGSIGVCIFLTAAELGELGVDPIQADAIEYRLVQVNDKYLLSITEASKPSDATARDSIGD